MPDFRNLEAMRAATENAHKWDIKRTAEAARETAKVSGETRELLDALVKHAIGADARERKMLHWTIAGVILAGIAAVASIVAILLAA